MGRWSGEGPRMRQGFSSWGFLGGEDGPEDFHDARFEGLRGDVWSC